MSRGRRDDPEAADVGAPDHREEGRPGDEPGDPAAGRYGGGGVSGLSSLARLLLWDYDRGTLAYDLLCLALLLFLFLVPPQWLGDPIAGRP